MEGRRLAANVSARDPETDLVEVFEAGTVPPRWAAARITNPDVWESQDTPTDPELGLGLVRPPLTGAGSGRPAWAAYATGQGIPVTDDLTKSEIIDAVEAAEAAAEA